MSVSATIAKVRIYWSPQICGIKAQLTVGSKSGYQCSNNETASLGLLSIR
jgi:hypothetical protein